MIGKNEQGRERREEAFCAVGGPALRRFARFAATAAILLGSASPTPTKGENESPEASTRGPAGTANTPGRNTVVIGGLDDAAEANARKIIGDQLALIRSRGLTRPRADDAAYYLEQGLRRLGYRDADVLWTIDPAGDTLRLTVENAFPRALGQLSFPGAPAEDIATLEGFATARTRGRSRGLPGRLPLVETDLETGVAAIADHYSNLGYWEAAAGPPEYRERENESTVDVSVPVEKGPLFHIAAIVFEGETALAPNLLEEAVAPFAGRPATLDTLLELRGEVSSIYEREGFYRAEVSLEPDPAPGGNLNLSIAIEANRAFTVTAVEIEGHRKLKPEFLRKRFEPLEGRPYRPSAVDAVLRDLVGQQLFDDISVVPEETGSDTLRLLVEVDEAKSREAGFYGGYGTFDGFILGMALRERNLFGTGRLIGLDAEINGRGQRGEIIYLDKWFLDSLWSLDARLFTLNEELEGYEKVEHGFRTELSRKFTPAYSISFFFNSSYTDVEGAGIGRADLEDPRYLVNAVGMTHTFDKRDSPVLPSDGFIVEGTMDYASAALGSEIDFLRASARFSYYKSFGTHYVLSLGARSGFIVPTEDTREIPIDLRFFSGGSTSVRSFPERELPSREGDSVSIGGEFYNTFNAELTRVITGAVRGAVFLDAGNLGREIGDFGLGDMRYAAGLGLRVDLPFGPLRADYGWSLDRREGEPAGAFHVTVGVAF